MTTRRQILTALLGAPLAASCKRGRRFDYDGRFVEDHARRGHGLRDGVESTGPALAPREVEVLIVGAGAAGLAAGWRLRREGLDDLAILDLADAPGGTSVGGRSAVTGYPWGAHYLPAPTAENPALVELLTEMGVVVDRRADGAPEYHEGVLCAAPRERVFYKGRWYPGLVPEAVVRDADLAELSRFRRKVDEWVAFRDTDGRRAFTIPVAACSDDRRARRLDALSMAEWLRRHGFESPMVQAVVDYACRDDFGARPADVSAWYGLHYFAARRPSPGAESAPFLTWPEGNARLVRHLAGRVGRQRLHLDTLVTSVRRRTGGFTVTGIDGATGRPRTWRARQVVCAVPSFVRARVLGETDPAFQPTYGAWMVANLHLSGRPRGVGFESSWDNVIFGSRSLGYVVATHQEGSAFGPTVWTWYLPLVGADATAERRRLQQLGWREAADVAVHELDQVHVGLARHLRRVDVRRWGHAMVRPEPGMAFGRARAGAARSVDGLHVAHSELSGVALFEEAFYHGDRAARAVLERRPG